MSFLHKVTLPSGSTYDLEGTVLSVAGTQASATNAWTGTTTLEELKTGVVIAYYLPKDGTTTAATLNLTLADGTTTTGAKSIYFEGTIPVKQQFKAGSLIIMYYDGTAWHTTNYIDTNNTYTPASAAPAEVTGTSGATTGTVGTSAKYAREDHAHKVKVETGDSSGQVKIGGQNVTVKDINNAAYKDVDSSISDTTSTKLPTSAAVANFVSTELGKLDALRFKGTIGTGGNPGTLPTTGVKVGDTYKVITAGTYGGIVCEVGDLIIAIATTPTWTVAQANIDGAVTGPSSSTADNIATFDGTTGKLIKDSGKTWSTGNTDTSASHVVLCNDSRLSDTRTPKSHTHGNIQNGGTLQTNDITIASGDKLIVTDSSDSNKIARTSTSFDGSTEKKALTPKGSWKEFLQTVSTTGSGNVVTAVAVNGTDASQLDVTKGITALTSHQTIKQDGVTGATVNRFGTCGIAAGTAAKTASITTGTFSLEAGAQVAIKFTYANTADSPTLNIGSTGAKNIYYKGTQITTGKEKNLLAGTCVFIYDGTQYHLIGGGSTFEPSDLGTDTVIKSSDANKTTLSDTTTNIVSAQGSFTAGDYPVTFSVSNETLAIANGTKPSLGSATTKKINNYVTVAAATANSRTVYAPPTT